MIYRQFQDVRLSALGLGCMRLPMTEGPDAVIDEDAAGALVDCAMANGINYYDTAWGYNNGNSEIVMGRLLRRYPRDSYYIATKFPGFSMDTISRVEEVFERQLEKTGMEYFDFYLFHNVCEANVDALLDDETYGVFSYLKRQKELGRIRHLGFSTHGSCAVMRRFLDAYGDALEFCQIQLNWLDWSLQDARAKVALLREYHMPIWVMEPLRGGRLVKLADDDADRLRALRPEESIPGWSFRFLQGLENVTMVLSGMSTLEQLEDNLHTFETERPLSPAEQDALFDIARRMTGGVPCTGCRYCTDYCPQGLDIPSLLTLYNEQHFNGSTSSISLRVNALAADKRPENCLACRSCESVCPQGIRISEVLAELRQNLSK